MKSTRMVSVLAAKSKSAPVTCHGGETPKAASNSLSVIPDPVPAQVQLTHSKLKVIPKQTGPNLRGFGHEAMSRMCRLSALSPGGRTSEVPRLRAAFHVDVGVGLGTTAHSDEGTPAGVVRAGRAVVPAAVPVR